MPTFDDGGDNVWREASQRSQLAKARAAPVLASGDAGDGLLGARQDEFPSSMRLGEE